MFLELNVEMCNYNEHSSKRGNSFKPVWLYLQYNKLFVQLLYDSVSI
jgi:hypothetical protein